jgi:putative addiction module CopG family antidote
MVQLQVSLPVPLSQYAMAQVSSGRFANVDDYLQALVRADEQAQSVAAKLSENPQLTALLEEGLNSGNGRSWSADVLAELKQQVVDRAGK